MFIGKSRAHTTVDIDSIVQLESNIDDLSPQAYRMSDGQLRAAGAVDVTFSPVIVEQVIPGVVISTLVPSEKAKTMLFHTSFGRHTHSAYASSIFSNRHYHNGPPPIQVRGEEVRMKATDIR